MPLLEYTGEFGTEVALFVPFVNYLKKSGQLASSNLCILTYDGMGPYYFFLEPHEITFKHKTEVRCWVPANVRFFLPEDIRNDDDIFAKGLPQPLMVPPDFVAEYRSKPTLFYTTTGRPIFVIQNKYNEEWGGPPVNFIPTAALNDALNKIKKEFKVVYIRSNDFRAPGYSTDSNEQSTYHLDDKDMIRKQHPDVTLFEDLLKELEPQGYTFNMLKCILHASASCTLSTIGGFNFFDAYWPSKHIIYKVDTPPTYTREFYQNQHNMLCPTPGEVVMVHNPHQLLEALDTISKQGPAPAVPSGPSP